MVGNRGSNPRDGLWLCHLKKRNPSQIQTNPSGSRKRRMCGMILMQIHANSGAKLECFVCKGEHALTSCETWKRLTVNERWELAKKLGLCFRCLKTGHRVERCSLKGTCPAEGRVRRHHPQLHAAIEPTQ